MNIKKILEDPLYYLNRILQEIELRTGIQCSKPSEVWLKLTERCNCRCQMCDIWKNNPDSEGELTTEEWKNVLLGLRQWLGKKHIWFTGGEPFLRKDCIDLIRYGSSIGLSIAVITNGILLRPDQMRLLIEGGLKEYHVSIDSMDSQIHDNLRGIKGAHKRVSENVLALKGALIRNGKKMKIVIKTIIMGYNADGVISLLEWTEKNDFNEIKFQALESNLEGINDVNWFKSSPYWPTGSKLEKTVEVMDELISKKRYGARIYNSVGELENMRSYFLDPVFYYSIVQDHTLGNKANNVKCQNVIGWMEILSHGGLRMCRNMPPQGNVRLTGPKKLWMNRPKCLQDPSRVCFKANTDRVNA